MLCGYLKKKQKERDIKMLSAGVCDIIEVRGNQNESE